MHNAMRKHFAIRKFSRPIATAICGALIFLGVAAAPETIGDFEAHEDVGICPRAGSAAYDAAKQEYTITGGGANMWANVDAFHFVWRKMSGDMTLSADIALQGAAGNEHRKAGLMIRQGLGPSDAYADAVIHGVGLTCLQYREKSGAETSQVQSPISSPQALKLDRHGNTFTLYVAGADRQFKQVGSASVELHDPLYVGLVVCAHDANDLRTAVFSHVDVVPGAAPAK
jgi:TolB protein